ncbi:glycosyltransferase family 2 protein [Vulcanisaeta sp. JCM 16159]|uniref:glycosyltransferase family 2 protein n=1 Tax=Vulcanisaeta sp. JCM 16159 TaxID=1295371 RepID=UPI0006CF6026|nr:hypothetical protein [Vulcanisaeta sp. JCM 16159]
MVVRVDAVKNSCPWGQPFISETFLYLDDNLLGLILWNRGYRIMYVPFETGIHYGGKTTGITESKITMGFYYMTRNYPILSKIIFTKYYKLRNLILNELIYSSYALCKAIDGKFCFYIYGFKHGEKLVKIIMPKIGTKLSLYRAPYIKVNLNELTSYILMYGYLGFHKVIPSMLSYDSIIE